MIFYNRKIIYNIFNEIYNDIFKYYSNILNKDEVLKWWILKLILMIKIFKIEVNMNNILWVFHWNLSIKMIKFDQEIEKKNRKKEMIHSIILLSKLMLW